jgi:hypothetical protein
MVESNIKLIQTSMHYCMCKLIYSYVKINLLVTLCDLIMTHKLCYTVESKVNT